MEARWSSLLTLIMATTPVSAEGSLLEGAWSDFWIMRFFVNLAGYTTIILPGYLLVQYFKRKNYLETGRGLCFPVIKTCVFGSEVKSGLPEEPAPSSRSEATESSSTKQLLKLLACALGLQGTKSLPGRLHSSPALNISTKGNSTPQNTVAVHPLIQWSLQFQSIAGLAGDYTPLSSSKNTGKFHDKSLQDYFNERLMELKHRHIQATRC